jgi:hypothetical protein
MSGDDQPTTQELKAIQVDKLEDEKAKARTAEEQAEERAAGRRADKAAYLAEKLDKQAEALDE